MSLKTEAGLIVCWPSSAGSWLLSLCRLACKNSRCSRHRASFSSSAIVHLFRGYRYSASGGEAYFLGVAEFAIAALLAAGAFSPILSAVGSLMGVVTFAITWSFFFTTPGVVKWSLSTDPIAWNLTGEFLFKDIVLLCVCAVLFLASLPQSLVKSRTA